MNTINQVTSDVTNQPITIGNYCLNHKGEVWCMEYNEMLYSSTFDDALKFLKSIT